jgi:hypothetical protein
MANFQNVEQIIEFIDDFMVNTYFSSSKIFEQEEQNQIKSLRFKINQSKHSFDLKVEEVYKKQLNKLENEFLYNVATKLIKIRKESVSAIICILNPFLTIFNEKFNNYLVESDIDEKNLLSFLSKD